LSRKGNISHADWENHVKDSPIQSPASSRQATAKNIFVEVLVVAITGAVFAFAANQISPRGLVISRNYFPAKNSHTTSAATNTPTAALSPAQLLAAQIRKNGLQLVDGDTAAKLFHDPRFKQNGIVFIDARDESYYQEGHIPGAYEFDPYHPDKYFPATLPICQTAEQIVVYCNGGDCDDSETAAILLRNVGVADQKLFIYAGGIAEWTDNNLPVETGARNSGNLRGTNK
jgi:rhodanese-related sulfurtransferase